MLPAARQLWLQTQPWQSLQPDCVKASAGLAVRSFSAQPGSDADTTPTRNMQLRLMHVVAIGMLIVAAARIIPIVWSSPIPQVLQLLEAEEPIMQLCCTKPVAAALHHHSQVPFRQLRYTKFVTAATPVQKAALHRLQSLAESDNNLDELLEGRAALKVVKMLKQPNADSGTVPGHAGSVV
eukprot:jgi/Astpho2/1277/fgenesh1_pg.00023_%23_28_t